MFVGMDVSTRLMRWAIWMLLRRLRGIRSWWSLFMILRYASSFSPVSHHHSLPPPSKLLTKHSIYRLTPPKCPVSQVISDALSPLVSQYPSIHFVRVHYEDIEFDNAGVPAILAYKNQGDLFANLTYIIDQIPDDTLFDTRALENILRKHKVL